MHTLSPIGQLAEGAEHKWTHIYMHMAWQTCTQCTLVHHIIALWCAMCMTLYYTALYICTILLAQYCMIVRYSHDRTVPVVLYHTVNVLYCNSVLYYMYRTALHCTALHCDALHCDALCYATTHCDVLYRPVSCCAVLYTTKLRLTGNRNTTGC